MTNSAADESTAKHQMGRLSKETFNILEESQLEDAWVIGPFMVKQKWILYAIAFIAGNIIVRIAIRLKQVDRSVIDSLWNAMFLFLVTWKFSYVLFQPIDALQHPMSVLYFTGGEKGIVLALCAVIIYFFWVRKKKSIPFRVLMETGLMAMITAIAVYQTLVWAIYSSDMYVILVESVFLFAIVIYGLIKDSVDVNPLWTKMVLWFSLVALFFSFFKPQMPILFHFSFVQLVYIATSIVVIVLSFRIERRSANG